MAIFNSITIDTKYEIVLSCISGGSDISTQRWRGNSFLARNHKTNTNIIKKKVTINRLLFFVSKKDQTINTQNHNYKSIQSNLKLHQKLFITHQLIKFFLLELILLKANFTLL